MYQIFCTISFTLSFLMLAALIHFLRKNVSIFYAMLFGAITIANFGYLIMAYAETDEIALLGNKVVYLGVGFIPFFLSMCVADLCKIKIPESFQLICVGSGALILLLICTNDAHHLYYTDFELVRTGSMVILRKDYGPFHALFPTLLFLLTFTVIGIVAGSLFRKKVVSHINSTILMVMMCILVAIYLLERIVDLPVEIMPMGYVTAQFIVFVLLRRIRLYDIAGISAYFMVKSEEYGFVLCDHKYRISGHDRAAEQWFPELMEMNIDYVVTREDTPFLKQLHRWMQGYDYDKTMYFDCDGAIIEAKYKKIRQRLGRPIHSVSLRDATKEQKYRKLMEEYNETLEREVSEKTEQIHQMRHDIILSMASIVENRDNNTGGHIKRTSDVMRIFVTHLRENDAYPALTEHAAKNIVKAASLHDFGKIAIKDDILNKPGRFTPEEYEEMKKHSEKGAVIVAQILQNVDDRQFRDIAVNVAHFHHERWDGNGYPAKISHNAIPFEARVMALADVFDALVSKRVYKERMGFDEAFRIISENSGTQFDPDLCSCFLECRPALEKLYCSYHDE